MTLLSATTSVSSSQPETELTEDTFIKKGIPAPFPGVLVPTRNYRDYSEAMDVVTLCKITESVIEPKEEPEGNYAVVAGVSGLVFGLVVGFISGQH